MELKERLQAKKKELEALGQVIPESYEDLAKLREQYELADIQVNFMYLEMQVDERIDSLEKLKVLEDENVSEGLL